MWCDDDRGEVRAPRHRDVQLVNTTCVHDLRRTCSMLARRGRGRRQSADNSLSRANNIQPETTVSPHRLIQPAMAVVAHDVLAPGPSADAETARTLTRNCTRRAAPRATRANVLITLTQRCASGNLWASASGLCDPPGLQPTVGHHLALTPARPTHAIEVTNQGEPRVRSSRRLSALDERVSQLFKLLAGARHGRAEADIVPLTSSRRGCQRASLTGSSASCAPGRRARATCACSARATEECRSKGPRHGGRATTAVQAAQYCRHQDGGTYRPSARRGRPTTSPFGSYTRHNRGITEPFA
jgi:hypothetical protein